LGVSAVQLSRKDVESWPLERDDIVLLYSDGVDKVLSPTEILELFNQHRSDPASAIVERILTEIVLKNGDDDRTVLVVLGPHLSSSDTLNANLETLLTQQESSQRALTELQNTVQSIPIHPQPMVFTDYTRILREQFQENFKNIEALLRNQLDKAQIENLSSELRPLLTAFKAGALSAATNPKTPVVDKSASLPTDNVSEPVRKKRDATTPEEKEVLPGAPITVGPSTPIREGVVHIRKGKIDLVDEVDIQVSRRPKRIGEEAELFLVSPPSVPAGWLTAWFLCVAASFRNEPHITYQPSKLREWALQLPTANLQNVSTEELTNLRDWHCALRDRRRSAKGHPYANIKREEREKAYEFYDNLKENSDQTQRPSTPMIISNPIWPKFRAAAMRPRSWLIIAAIFGATLLAYFLVSSLLGSKPKKNTSPNQTAASTQSIWKVGYGADGRTILLISGNQKETTGFRIRFGKESDFRNKWSQEEFSSSQNGRAHIMSDTAQLIATGSEEELGLPANVKSYKVIESDLKTPCIDFLKRVNKLLPPGVHNEVADLEKLNPDLRCDDLKQGDDLLVYKSNPRN
jgi:hypothetical protein